MPSSLPCAFLWNVRQKYHIIPEHPNVKITVFGIAIFLVLGIAFFVWFGGPPSLPDDSYMSHRGTTRAWFYCSILFLTGAGTACFGDREYGMFPPTSLRWLFIVFGVFIMAASAAWMHSLTSVWGGGKSASLLLLLIEAGRLPIRAGVTVCMLCESVRSV